MMHPIHRVRSFHFAAQYTLRLQFDDQTEQVINFEPVLAGERFRPAAGFIAIQSSSNGSRGAYSGLAQGADFDPATLHDWPEYAEALATGARQWDKTHA